MRKITTEASRAFYNLENFSLSNTLVKVSEWTSKMYLHWNLIAKLEGGKLYISSAGWETPTTKERLNWILYGTDFIVKQKNYTWYLEDIYSKECVPFLNFDNWSIETF